MPSKAPNNYLDSLFDKDIVRVVLERVDGELVVTEIDFQPCLPASSSSAVSHGRHLPKGDGVSSK